MEEVRATLFPIGAIVLSLAGLAGAGEPLPAAHDARGTAAVSSAPAAEASRGPIQPECVDTKAGWGVLPNRDLALAEEESLPRSRGLKGGGIAMIAVGSTQALVGVLFFSLESCSDAGASTCTPAVPEAITIPSIIAGIGTLIAGLPMLLIGKQRVPKTGEADAARAGTHSTHTRPAGLSWTF
jgi:hypothetical protein